MLRSAASATTSSSGPFYLLPRPDVQLDEQQHSAPLDSASQEAIVEGFWRDKEQQDTAWKVVLHLTSALLLLLLVSLWWSPYYSPLHSAFTLQLSGYFSHSAAAALPLSLLLLIASVLCSASLSRLLTSSRASPKEELTAAWPVRASALLQLGVVGLPLLSSVQQGRLSFYGCLPFVLCVLYWLMALWAAHSSDRLARQVRQLSKMRYQFHEL